MRKKYIVMELQRIKSFNLIMKRKEILNKKTTTTTKTCVVPEVFARLQQ